MNYLILIVDWLSERTVNCNRLYCHESYSSSLLKTVPVFKLHTSISVVKKTKTKTIFITKISLAHTAGVWMDLLWSVGGRDACDLQLHLVWYLITDKLCSL